MALLPREAVHYTVAAMRPLYLTTPIYYVNDKPHIGHAYTTIATDALARYHQLRGRPVRFLTGTDEHGLKIERRAQEEKLSPQAFVDRIAPRFREMCDLLHCRIHDFIRTTEPRHEERVQELWRRLAARGDVYLGDYEDWYCVACEQFYLEKDLGEDKLCPTHKRPVERIKESSYFFKLSAYGDRLLAHYEANPGFVQPEGRFNEVKSFVREGLRDLSISRTSFRWGVPVPGDPEHVMYVWLDALTNYISALGGPPDEGTSAPLFERFWPPHGDVIHMMAKDILRFHAIYWPAFLMSAGLPLPNKVVAHGWLTVNGDKMAKSTGNAISPGPLVEQFGADVIRYALLRDVGFGQDGDFSITSMLARYHGELGNGLGNLLNRMVASIVKNNLDGRVPRVEVAKLPELEQQLAKVAVDASRETAKHWDAIAPHRALEASWELVAAANKYVDQTAPWALAKSGDRKRLEEVAYTTLECLRFLSVMLWPVLPSKCDALREQLGLSPVMPVEGLDMFPSVFGALEGGLATRPAAALFPRFEKPEEQAILEKFGAKRVEEQKPTSDKKAEPKDAAPSSGTIEIDDLVKVSLKLGLVQTAERVPKSDKLLRLVVDLGEGTPRQILAGIGKTYEPEQLVGKRIVVVANLKPRKMMGLESHGMVLAASDEQGLSALFVDKELAPGSVVK